ncbi:hypothetical protein VCRA2126O85_150108 [Vibrio crassostreae]|nr:hypothetical protein VCRA2126O86_120017 [Vibrio crassostreae]CAK2597562.1 hypothetical protein VCRA2127O91_120017 [Vibrio crassostreae]CAK2612388.1 hypothetical protein VCRA2126O84_130016 [Vibrio crassostreae]CAK2622531.1 hypothetical protein VCRA2128O100_130115 [Vibrio crassostreae]CAK2651050.1 hypothetical protein VCRA2126O85_150108 [Vibrio crassostreae]
MFKRSGFAFKAPPQGVGVIGTPSCESFSVSKVRLTCLSDQDLYLMRHFKV